MNMVACICNYISQNILKQVILNYNVEATAAFSSAAVASCWGGKKRVGKRQKRGEGQRLMDSVVFQKIKVSTN